MKRLLYLLLEPHIPLGSFNFFSWTNSGSNPSSWFVMNRRIVDKWIAWLSMGLVLLTLSTAFVSVCPDLHQLIHEHANSHGHENDSGDGSSDSDSGSHSGSCLACSMQSGSIDSSAPNFEVELFSDSIILSSTVNRSESAGTVDYLFPLSQAPPYQAWPRLFDRRLTFLFTWLILIEANDLSFWWIDFLCMYWEPCLWMDWIPSDNIWALAAFHLTDNRINTLRIA